MAGFNRFQTPNYMTSLLDMSTSNPEKKETEEERFINFLSQIKKKEDASKGKVDMSIFPENIMVKAAIGMTPADTTLPNIVTDEEFGYGTGNKVSQDLRSQVNNYSEKKIIDPNVPFNVSQLAPYSEPKKDHTTDINHLTKQLNEDELNEKTRYGLEQKYKEYTGKDFDYPWYTDTSNWLKNTGNTIWDMITPNSWKNGKMIDRNGVDNSITSEEQTRILNDQSKNLQNEWLLKNPILGPENKPEGFALPVETPVQQMYDIQKGDTISELLWKNKKGGTKLKDLYNFINQQKDWGQYGIGNDPNKIFAGKQMNLQKLLQDFETYTNR